MWHLLSATESFVCYVFVDETKFNFFENLNKTFIIWIFLTAETLSSKNFITAIKKLKYESLKHHSHHLNKDKLSMKLKCCKLQGNINFNVSFLKLRLLVQCCNSRLVHLVLIFTVSILFLSSFQFHCKYACCAAWNKL